MELELALDVIALATKVAPIIEAKIKSGEISPDEQEKVRVAYAAYRAAMETAFSAPEWQQSQGGTGG